MSRDEPNGTTAFQQTPNAERYLLEADSLRRRQLRAALLHGTARSWRQRGRIWPAIIGGIGVTAIIVAAIAVAGAFQQQQRINDQPRVVSSLGLTGNSPAAPAHQHPALLRTSLNETETETAVGDGRLLVIGQYRDGQEVRMTIVSVRLPARPLTLDDVAELADGDPDHRYELQEGNLLVMPPADTEHAEMIMRIGAWLINQGFGGRVLAAPGMRAGSSGRSPDVVVRRTSGGGRVVWIDPADVLLTIEIVSPGSVVLDRHLKPVEYAQAGVPHFWRVERDGRPTVHLFGLGVSVDGQPVYVARGTTLLDDLLAGPAPVLD